MKKENIREGLKVSYHRREERYADGGLIYRAFDQHGVIKSGLHIDYGSGITSAMLKGSSLKEGDAVASPFTHQLPSSTFPPATVKRFYYVDFQHGVWTPPLSDFLIEALEELC